jgi:hypothetical protein
MFALFKLEDGSEVKLPLLDGVLERGIRLTQKWIEQKPELASVPPHKLILQGIECADVERILEGFERSGIKRDVALGYAHSHLSELLMYSSIVSLLGRGTWHLEQPMDSPETAPSFRGLTLEMPRSSQANRRVRPSEKELKKSSEFAADFPQLIGSEATEHLLQAVLAYDRWVRKQREEK